MTMTGIYRSSLYTDSTHSVQTYWPRVDYLPNWSSVSSSLEQNCLLDNAKVRLTSFPNAQHHSRKQSCMKGGWAWWQAHQWWHEARVHWARQYAGWGFLSAWGQGLQSNKGVAAVQLGLACSRAWGWDPTSNVCVSFKTSLPLLPI